MAFKILTHLAVLKCNYGGIVSFSGVNAKNALSVGGKHVTDVDLFKRVWLTGCKNPVTKKPCKSIVAISLGLAKDIDVKAEKQILENLVAVTDQACIVKLVTSFADLVSVNEERHASVYEVGGNPTIGVGHDLVADKGLSKTSGVGGLGLTHADLVSGKVNLTEAQIDTLLREDIATARRGAASLLPNDGFSKLSEGRQDALTELVFNMGVNSVKKFKNMLTALGAGENQKAVNELLTGADGKTPSKWLKDVHEMRAARIAAAILGSDVYADPQ